MKIALLILLTALTTVASAQPNWNIRTNPLTLIVGPNLRVDYRVNEQWSVGATGLYIDNQIKAVNIRESAGGLAVQYSNPFALDTSWFVSVNVAYGEIHASALASNNQVESTRLYNFKTRVIGGYQWFWGGFNFAAAGGIENNSAGDRDIDDPAGNKVNRIPIRRNLFVPELTVGWAF